MTVKEIVAKNVMVDYRPFDAVTTKTRKENGQRNVIGSIRLGSSMYRTDKEKSRFIKKAWRTKL